MRIFLLFISLSSVLIATIKTPLWIKTDPDSSSIYFRGVSAWYVTDDALTTKVSKKDARNSAYSEVSEYFGLNITSSFEMRTVSDGANASTVSKSNIKTKTNQLIFDMKPVKSYEEYSEDEENFRLHILLKLDKPTELKIKREMKRDEKEFKNLKAQILNYIELKDFFKAQNLLEIAKGKRSAYKDDTISTLEQRVQKLKDATLVATLDINKKHYRPNEEILVEVSLNSQGYLYLFYDTGSDVEMLYPNKYQRNNYIDKHEMLSFPNDDITQLIAYEESKQLNTNIYAIASKENLTLQRYRYDMIDGISIFKKDGEYQDMINRCIKQANCTKTKLDFTISNKTQHQKIKLAFNTASSLEKKIVKFLRSKGVISENSDKKIIFDILKRTRYSQLLAMNIEKYQIKVHYFNRNQLLKSKTIECAKSELLSKILELSAN